MEENKNFLKVNILDDNDEIIISSTKIRNFENRLILSGENFVQLDHKKQVKLVGNMEDGIVIMLGIITLSTEAQINLDILDKESKKERRSYIKVRSNLRTKVLKCYGAGPVGQKKSMQLSDNIELRDISVGGIGFYANKPFFKNQKLLIDFSELKPELAFSVKILRKERELIKPGYRYKYGCCFLDIDSEQQQTICGYVFKLEIENYKKLKHINADN